MPWKIASDGVTVLKQKGGKWVKKQKASSPSKAKATLRYLYMWAKQRGENT